MKRMILFLTSFLLLTGCGGNDAPVTFDNSSQNGSASDSIAVSASSLESADADSSTKPEDSALEEALVSNDLELDTPENHGVDSAMLDALHAAITEAEEPEVLALVIARNGAIIDEYYSQQYDETSLFYLASCTKSFTGALIGIAIDEGLISSVDVKLSEYFPALADGEDGKEEITLEHLLTHTSGIQWDEWNGGAMFHELQQAENPVKFILDQPMAAAPGSTFNYNSGGSHLLSAVLEKATGESAFDFAREHLFGPLGMDSVNWPADPQGIIDGSSNIEMTARDAVKFGQLYLSGGRWKERQIISQEWVEQSTTVPYAGTGGRTGQYGYQWWIRPFGDKHYDTFFAMGGGGHYIFVVPDLELVVVMSCYNHGDSYAPWPYLTDYILPACGE